MQHKVLYILKQGNLTLKTHTNTHDPYTHYNNKDSGIRWGDANNGKILTRITIIYFFCFVVFVLK